jgi:pimeloyl-ACP methyl ester carboxylesterase
MSYSAPVCTFLFLAGIYIAALLTRFIYSIIKIYTHPKCKQRDQEHNPTIQAFHNPDMVQKSKDLTYYAHLLGLELITYDIITKDGFILSLQRLYNPHVDINVINNDFKPILFIHGLLQSSGSFLTSGYKSLAYLLVSNGYDVWLGNNRCGFNPRHKIYKKNDHEMWDWDLNEMTKYDIPAMIDYIKMIKINSNHKISIISHSQGTTQCVYMFSKQFNKEIDKKYINLIDNCVLLAPAVYGGSLLNSKIFIKFMRLLPNSIYNFFFGKKSFMPIMVHLRNLTYNLPGFGWSSYIVFSYLFNWNDHLWDPKIRDLHFLFSPVYVSVKLMKWWLHNNKSDNNNNNGFQMNKPIISDPLAWFTNDTPNLLLIIPGKDNLVNGDLFINRLKNIEIEMINKWKYLKIEEYSHLDVLWADDVIQTIGFPILNFLQREDVNDKMIA